MENRLSEERKNTNDLLYEEVERLGTIIASMRTEREADLRVHQERIVEILRIARESPEAIVQFLED